MTLMTTRRLQAAMHMQMHRSSAISIRPLLSLQMATTMTTSASSGIIGSRTMATTPLAEHKVRPVVIDKNLKLWSLTPVRQLNNEPAECRRQRKLMILFAYMLPNEKHLDKYRKIYYEHGFDILTVQTSPFQFFFPSVGAKKVADHVYQFIERQGHSDSYPDVLIHAFSVGGYQFSEFLHKLYSVTGDGGLRIRQAIKGTVFDSPCNVDSVPYGLSRTIAGNTLLASLIEGLVLVTRRLFYPLSLKYHREGEDIFVNQPLNCPSLFFASKSDKMADIGMIEKTVNVWSSKGVDVKLRAWENTRHVSHYHAHPDEYSTEVANFLTKIQLSKDGKDNAYV